MAAKPLDINRPDLIERYLAGESEYALAQEAGVGRYAFRSYLTRNNIDARSVSEANILRMQALTPNQRRANTEAAHRARRGQKDSLATLEKRAASHAQSGIRIGRWEKELADELVSRGVPVIPQLAVSKYNIDLACGDVAVEVHSAPGVPHKRERLRERIEYLADHQWHSVYVMAYFGLTFPDVTDNMVSLLDVLQGNPPTPGEYWVVRRSGEFYTVPCHDGD